MSPIDEAGQNLAVSRLCSAADAAGDALPVLDWLTGVTVPLELYFFHTGIPWRSLRNVSAIIQGRGNANLRVCGLRPVSAGALLRESAQLVAWTRACGAEKSPSGLKTEPLPSWQFGVKKNLFFDGAN